jgi:GrpB-like predicted nucleotidyltransferase (UPF0157 family)
MCPRKMETLEQKVARVLKDEICVAPYDPSWPALFEEEKRHLISCLPPEIVRRIEHFGSTAVPGLAAKPVIDMLVEVRSLEETKRRIAPVLEAKGYDYFWRPSRGDDTPPFYAWFIKRAPDGRRTHHIHMVEADFEHWNRLLFRDYLIAHPKTAEQYGRLKQMLSKTYKNDRIAYTEAKTDFILTVTREAEKCRPPSRAFEIS